MSFFSDLDNCNRVPGLYPESWRSNMSSYNTVFALRDLDTYTYARTRTHTHKHIPESGFPN